MADGIPGQRRRNGEPNPDECQSAGALIARVAFLRQPGRPNRRACVELTSP